MVKEPGQGGKKSGETISIDLATEIVEGALLEFDDLNLTPETAKILADLIRRQFVHQLSIATAC